MEAADGRERDRPKDAAEKIREVGGLAAVVVGVVSVAAVAIGALVVDSQIAGTIAASAAAAIGSMVGAYFGVKVGTDQSKNTAQKQQEESSKAQVFAAHVPEEKADLVVQQVMEVAEAFARKK
jgi:Na+/H+-dicarboxylate symporter